MALAISDTLFSVAIHPMLIATSFGVSPHELFGVSGKTVSPYALSPYFFFQNALVSEIFKFKVENLKKVKFHEVKFLKFKTFKFDLKFF